MSSLPSHHLKHQKYSKNSFWNYIKTVKPQWVLNKCCLFIHQLLEQNGTLKQNTNITPNKDHDVNGIAVWPGSLWTDAWALKPVLFKYKNDGAAGLGNQPPTLRKRSKYQDSRFLHSHSFLFTATVILSWPVLTPSSPRPLEFKCSLSFALWQLAPIVLPLE